MMRSLYSAVAGLKTHQTKMDVIGNNIANVNTIAFKSSSVTFSDIMYQTTSGASGPNASNGTGGINPKQIGLGTTLATTKVSITTAGATQTTGSALDCKINGNSFFIVSDGTSNYFTRVGSFYFDAAGNLCLSSTGYNVMGWQVDPTSGEIKKDTVSALRIMSATNQISSPEATTNATVTGVLDSNSTAVSSESGYVMNLSFYDSLGYSYTAKFKVAEGTGDGKYNVSLSDILDSNGKSILTGNVTAKDLFGTADPAVSDTGTLLSGRYANLRKIDTTDATDPLQTYTVEGIAAGATAPEIYRYYMTETESATNTYADAIDNAVVYLDENGNFYALSSKTEGGTTTNTFVPLSNTSSDYSSLISQTEVDIQNFLATNFAGVDSDLYIDGNSSLKNITQYQDIVTINSGTSSYQFTTINSWRINEDPATPGQYYMFNEATAEYIPAATVAGGVITPNYQPLDNFDTQFKDPTVFSTTTPTATITTLMTQLGAGTATATLDNDNTSNNVEGTYTIGLVGTKYYSVMTFDTGDGTFDNIGGADVSTLVLSKIGPEFENLTIDWTQVTNFNNSGTSTMSMERGDKDGSTGAGKKLGTMTGVSIDTSGMIYGSYDNGNTVLLGQIAVASFANASGLEAVGDSLFQTTLNSGEFDGIGQDITADGGSITTGALEMSNVDLSAEFTDMITTQRGFQANSRVITTSDTLLEELINLKR